MLQPLLKSVAAQKPHILKIKYETGVEKLFDVSPYISGTWFQELENWEYFQQVQLTVDRNGVEWPHGQDIAPHELWELSQELK